MKTNDIKQIMVTRFEKPIDEVQEAFDELEQDVISAHEKVKCVDQYVIDNLGTLRDKITNLKALLPTLQ